MMKPNIILATGLCLLSAFFLAPQTKATTPNQMDGLIYLHGRYYDPHLMRFMSPDPYIPETSNLGINRYAYVENTPVNATDPSGYRPVRRSFRGMYHTALKHIASLRARIKVLERNPVSGLPGGHLYQEALKDAKGKPVSHAYVDVFNFKAVNDGTSHAVGDEVLKNFGQTLQETVGDKGDVFHPHGDEFQIIGKPGVSEAELNTCLLEAQNKCNITIPSAEVKGGIETGINFGIGDSPGKAEQAMKIQKNKMYADKPHLNRRSGFDRRLGDPIRGKFHILRGGIVGIGIGIAIDNLIDPDPAYSETHTLDPKTYNNALGRLSGHNPVLPPHVVAGEAQCYGQVHAAC